MHIYFCALCNAHKNKDEMFSINGYRITEIKRKIIVIEEGVCNKCIRNFIHDMADTTIKLAQELERDK